MSPLGKHLSLHSGIHPNKYLVIIYYVPGTNLDVGDTLLLPVILCQEQWGALKNL